MRVCSLALLAVGAVALMTGGAEARLHPHRHSAKAPVAVAAALPPQQQQQAKLPQLRSDACGGSDYGTSGQFDYYVYAQSWPAAFCQEHQDWPGCSNPTSWQQVNLTLHGMWPNYAQAQGKHEWPQCCESAYGNSLDTSIARSLLPAWKTYWPNEQDPSGGDLSSSLWAHEWQKHGTCSGLDQRTYFTEAMTIELSMPTPDAISNNVGGSASLSDLQSAFRMGDCQDGGDCWSGLSCSGSDGGQQLTGVTTCWSTSFQRIICPAASLSGKQCSSDQISIPSF